MPYNHLILCFLLFLLPSIFTSIKVFSNDSALPIRWWKYGSFSFSLSPSNVYSGLISFRIDWFDLLSVQGILKSLLQQHNLKASILQRSVFFMVQVSHPYMTTGKKHSFDYLTFVSKMMSLLFNTLSKFVKPFLVAQIVKSLPAMQEAQVWSLRWEYPLEKGMTTHFSMLAWRIPWTKECSRIQSTGLQRVGHNWVTNNFLPRRKHLLIPSL